MIDAPSITSFSGPHEFLSNFYRSPVIFEGLVFPSVEHAFQATKTNSHYRRVEFTDPRMTCANAKRLGRRLSLRPNWEDVKADVMTTCLRAKFARGSELAARLIETQGLTLVEGNTWHDNEWGSCLCGSARCQAPGKNKLGALLMQVRWELSGCP
jgi:ribA/ribD-fused uncharacterized protein